MYTSNKGKNYLYEWIKCPRVLLHLLNAGDVCIDTLDILHSPNKTILDCFAFKKNEFTDVERELVLFILDRKNRMFEKSLWGYDFLKHAKEIGSPNEAFFLKAIETLYRPKDVIMPVLKWNVLQKPKLRDHTLETILSFLFLHDKPANTATQIVFDR